MEYYYLRNNIEEAKNYAEEFLMLKTKQAILEKIKEYDKILGSNIPFETRSKT